MTDSRAKFCILKEDKGFTLVDAIISVVIATIVITLAVNFFNNQTRLYTRETQLSTLRSESLRALAELTGFLKMAGFDPTQSGNFGLVQASPNEITFTWDKDADGILDPDETVKILYVSAENTIYLYYPSVSPDPIRKIAQNIDFFSLTYIDANLDTLGGGGPLSESQLDLVRAVDLYVVGITERPIYGQPVTGQYPDGSQYNDRYGRYEVSIRVKLRNLAV